MKFEKIHYPTAWNDLVDKAELVASEPPRHQLRGGIDGEAMLIALGPYKLACFCERLRSAQRCTWNDTPCDLPARLHLIQKYHWTLPEVMTLNEEELMLALHEDLVTMKLKPIEADPIRAAGQHREVFSQIKPHLQPT